MGSRAKEPLRAGIGRKFLMHKEYGSVVYQLNGDLDRAIQEFMVGVLRMSDLEEAQSGLALI